MVGEAAGKIKLKADGSYDDVAPLFTRAKSDMAVHTEPAEPTRRNRSAAGIRFKLTARTERMEQRGRKRDNKSGGVCARV